MTSPLKEMLRGIRAEDTHAIEEFVHRFRPEALRLARALLDDAALAEDAVQEALVTALQKAEQVQDASAFPAWWRQVVRSHCYRVTRKNTATPVERDRLARIHDTKADPEQQAQRKQLRAVVRTAVEQLPDIGRKEAELFYFEERSQREIAELLGVPTGTVKRRLHTARKRLRDMFTGGLPSQGVDSEGPGW